MLKKLGLALLLAFGLKKSMVRNFEKLVVAIIEEVQGKNSKLVVSLVATAHFSAFIAVLPGMRQLLACHLTDLVHSSCAGFQAFLSSDDRHH